VTPKQLRPIPFIVFRSRQGCYHTTFPFSIPFFPAPAYVGEVPHGAIKSSSVPTVKSPAIRQPSINSVQLDRFWICFRTPSITKRAWCFQERLLSTRLVYFGQNKLLWDCQTSLCCERSASVNTISGILPGIEM
jgi:hypothetical protein